MLEEFLVVFSNSWRAQLLLALGILMFFALQIGGAWYIHSIDLGSLSDPFADVIREKLLHRYDKAAWVILFSCVAGAVRAYLKDRKRLLRYY
jgi:energy-coupling factor transporter transmembrane protein EcfT